MQLEVAVQETDLRVQHLGLATPEQAWDMVMVCGLHEEFEAYRAAMDDSWLTGDYPAWSTHPQIMFRRPEGHVLRLIAVNHGVVNVEVTAACCDRLFWVIPQRFELTELIDGGLPLDEAKPLFERFVTSDAHEIRLWVEQVMSSQSDAIE